MKKVSVVSLAFLAVALMPATPQLHAAGQSVDGVVSDTMCGKKHMMPGKSDAQCVQGCVKEGASYALVVGDKVYTLTGKTAAVAPLAGKQVRVEGAVNGSTITVASISAKK